MVWYFDSLSTSVINLFQMGAITSKKTPGQVLLLGPSEAGKTTLLYFLIFTKHDYQETKTTGFHFEQIQGGEGPNKQTVGVWDIAGNSPPYIVA